MKQDLNLARRAAGLLIAAAALPLTPVVAQDAQPPAQPPPAAQPTPEPAPPPAAQAAPVVVPPLAPPTVTPAPVPTANVAPFPSTAPAPAPVRSAPTARATPRPAARAPATAASRPARPAATATAAATRPAPAQAPAHVDFVAPSQPAASAPAAAPAPVAAPPPGATAPISPQPTAARSTRSLLPWLVIGLLLLGAAAFALARRRRRDDVVYDEPEVAPVAAVAAAPEAGRPWLDLALEPVRAGVEGREAVVEFALKLNNHGVAPARDVRVSTFMLQAGASEAERGLIEPKEANPAPPVTIAPGEAKQVRTAVALSTSSVTGDSVLPVVVADARYTLPDGSEGRTSASFAVGVPDGEELAHFAVDNPSGLHEDVVARPMGEMEKA